MTEDHMEPNGRISVDTAYRCEHCNRRWYYTRGRCPDCGHEAVATYTLGVGELLAWTRVEVTASDVRTPNRLGLVAFDDVRVIAQLRDGEVEVGDRVGFAGEHSLREGDERAEPRLAPTDNVQ